MEWYKNVPKSAAAIVEPRMPLLRTAMVEAQKQLYARRIDFIATA
jgi:hypothetical protein